MSLPTLLTCGLCGEQHRDPRDCAVIKDPFRLIQAIAGTTPWKDGKQTVTVTMKSVVNPADWEKSWTVVLTVRRDGARRSTVTYVDTRPELLAAIRGCLDKYREKQAARITKPKGAA